MKIRDNLFIIKSTKGLFKLDVCDIQNPNCQKITGYNCSYALANSIQFKIIDNKLFLYTEYYIENYNTPFLRKVEIPLVRKEWNE